MNDSMHGNTHARQDTWRNNASLVAHVLGAGIVFIKKEALSQKLVFTACLTRTIKKLTLGNLLKAMSMGRRNDIPLLWGTKVDITFFSHE
jgi:hypothetical protein